MLGGGHLLDPAGGLAGQGGSGAPWSSSSGQAGPLELVTAVALEWEAPSVRKDTTSLTTVWADSENPAAGSSGSGSWRNPERKEAPRAGEGWGPGRATRQGLWAGGAAPPHPTRQGDDRSPAGGQGAGSQPGLRASLWQALHQYVWDRSSFDQIVC